MKYETEKGGNVWLVQLISRFFYGVSLCLHFYFVITVTSGGRLLAKLDICLAGFESCALESLLDF